MGIKFIALNFLLDTGVEETILLSLDDKEGLNFNNVEKILFIDSYRGSNESKNKIYQSLKKMQFNFAQNEFSYCILYQNYIKKTSIQRLRFWYLLI